MQDPANMRAAREGIGCMYSGVLRVLWLILQSGLGEHMLGFFQMILIQKLCSGSTPNVLHLQRGIQSIRPD